MVSPLVKSVGADWRAKGVDSSSWKPTAEERPGGEAQGFWVVCGALRGYLKPSKAAEDVANHPRAAHEKIAADLAFDLGLPVSPAVLVDGVGCGGLAKAAVISLAMFPEIHKWSHVTTTQGSAAIAHHILRSTTSEWSGIVAFDTWLDNTDRNNEGNLLIGVDPSAATPLCEPIFCDYANSMIHSKWTKGGQHSVAVATLLPVMTKLFDRNVALAMAKKIKTFANDAIDEIVKRIPEDYLQAVQKDLIVEGLLQRREVLSDVIAACPK